MAKDWKPMRCGICNKKFIPYSSTQKYCQEPCTSKGNTTIEEINRAWLQRDKRKTIKRKNQIGMRFLGN